MTAVNCRANAASRGIALLLVGALHGAALFWMQHGQPIDQPAGTDDIEPLQVSLLSLPPAAPELPAPPRPDPLPVAVPDPFATAMPMPALDLVPATVAEPASAAAPVAPAAQAESVRREPGIAQADCLPMTWLAGMSRTISRDLRYPRYSRDLRHRGTATLRVSVARSGNVREAVLLRGTGHSLLDIEARDVLRRIGRFAPVPADACRGADIVVIDQPIGFGMH